MTGTVSLDAKSHEAKLSDQFNADAGQEVHIKGGLKVVIEAGTELTIMVGGSFVKIDAGGVTIVGAPQVKINSGGAPGSGSPCQVTAPEPPEAAKPPPPES